MNPRLTALLGFYSNLELFTDLKQTTIILFGWVWREARGSYRNRIVLVHGTPLTGYPWHKILTVKSYPSHDIIRRDFSRVLDTQYYLSAEVASATTIAAQPLQRLFKQGNPQLWFATVCLPSEIRSQCARQDPYCCEQFQFS